MKTQTFIAIAATAVLTVLAVPLLKQARTLEASAASERLVAQKKLESPDVVEIR